MDDLPGAVIRQKKEALCRQKTRVTLFVSLAATAMAVFVLFGLLMGVGVVKGGSMSPTFEDGSVVLIRRVGSRYSRGDIVSLRRRNGGSELIKRIVALPGDTVDIRDGRLWVNGIAAAEPYAAGRTEPKAEGCTLPMTLKSEEYFVLGDQREISKDSRGYGAIRKDEIKGKAIFFARTLR